MAFLSHERIVASVGVVKTYVALTAPAIATSALLQADSSDIRYTMDGATDPTQTSGMVLVNGLEPEEFLIEDIQKIRFLSGSGSVGGLNVHYFAGRTDL